MMKTKLKVTLALVPALVAISISVHAWTPKPIHDDPLFRMPGTQPDQGVTIKEPVGCIECHGEVTTIAGNLVVPGTFWAGSMMAQAARDPIFWATMAVGIQDSIWLLGNPNAADICLRCHFPEGWLEQRSGHRNPNDLNASAMTGSDFDGVHCDFCHKLFDPFFETTFNGTREGDDWMGYWDEAANTGPGSGTASQNGAEATLNEDRFIAGAITLFNGNGFYLNNLPVSTAYDENGSGQFFVSPVSGEKLKRANFADTVPGHTVLYSRYHKSKFFCSTCHDVSNPALANLPFANTLPGDGTTVLPTEQQSAYSYGHVERTFSEFMVSAYGQPGGAPTNPEFQAQGADTITHAAKCQDCHMRDVLGRGCQEEDAPLRPVQSAEHPNSGAPLHDLQGGNAWITHILGTLDADLNTFDQVNYDLLTQGTRTLTVNMAAGHSPLEHGELLFAAADRAKFQLALAASIKDLSYNPANGALAFKVQNNTGHKLLSGYPEGRRMFVNIKSYSGANLIHEVNPYDFSVGTLRGLDPAKIPSSPALGANEAHVDELVYEVHPKSDFTGEAEKTFHFVLATDRYKDNRIPPKGFDFAAAPSRLVEPVWGGKRSCMGDFDSDGDVDGIDWSVFRADFGRLDCATGPACEGDFNQDGIVDLEDFRVFAASYGKQQDECSLGSIFTPAEFAGGYDEVMITIPAGADRVEVALYYQGTTREYNEFLRDEINGTAATPNFLTLSSPSPSGEANAYIAQTDSFFQGLKAWGNTIWDLWVHNHGLDGSGKAVAGIVPFEMTRATWQ